ncbi:MAG: diaminopimelate dehydrogenase [Alistipes sp.]|jgi:diaminopimelate dehydrogenase|nr:diaminopimelate dehydrogenase [Alistipes sp.]
MTKIKAAVVGYGNIGRFVVEALEAAVDFEVAGVVRRSAAGSQPAEIAKYSVVDNIDALGGVDVAVVCSPSREVEHTAAAILKKGICTVDSFDIHSAIVDTRGRLDNIARAHNTVAVVAAGWDPGSDSVVRALLEACAPAGTTHTNFGPGMSMGHSVAARAVPGVRNALSMTIPVGGGVHRREVFVETEPGADFGSVAAAIKSDPYFASDDTRVEQVADVAALVDMMHGVNIVREGTSGRTAGQRFEFSMRILNPALTAQILVSVARAAVRLKGRAQSGAFTMIELAPIDMLPGEREDNIRRLV